MEIVAGNVDTKLRIKATITLLLSSVIHVHHLRYAYSALLHASSLGMGDTLLSTLSKC
jgi:hypothetical protein